jgi:hypothetical protein
MEDSEEMQNDECRMQNEGEEMKSQQYLSSFCILHSSFCITLMAN